MKSLLTPRLYCLMVVVGVSIGLMLFSFYLLLSSDGHDIVVIRTMMFLLISMTALVVGLLMKRLRGSALTHDVFANRSFWVAFGLSVFLLLSAFFVTPLRHILDLAPLSLDLPWKYFGIGVFLTILLVESMKWVFVRGGKV